MKWYGILGLIVAFVAIVGVLLYLGKKKGINSKLLHAVQSIVSGVSDLIGLYSEKHKNNPTVDMIDKAVELVEKAVLAAENMWYNGQISAEERHATCLSIFTELLETYGITLPENFMLVIDNLIAAACESLGHMRVSKSEIEAALVGGLEE